MYQKFKRWALQKFNLKETTYNNYISMAWTIYFIFFFIVILICLAVDGGSAVSVWFFLNVAVFGIYFIISGVYNVFSGYLFDIKVSKILTEKEYKTYEEYNMRYFTSNIEPSYRFYNDRVLKVAIKLTDEIGRFNKYGYKVVGLE